ncbi:MAG TPA: IS110 family transposase [Thermoanaerobaculia bacterium]|nr:IS110 family transposase [Thermoanaerobaculia bacterium]
MDLGDRHSQFCRLDQESGAILAEKRVPTTAPSFQRCFSGLAPHLFVVESGTHTPWVSRLLRQLGHEVIVANPSKMQAIASSRRKTDERDARCLAQLARVDPELLSPVHPRSEEAQQALAVVRAREGLVRTRTKLINQVRGTVKAFGGRLPASSTSSFARRAQEALPGELRGALEPLVRVIAPLSEEIAGFDREIEAWAQKWPATQRLRQIRGVGALTSLVFVLIIGDPLRFARSRAVGAYLGLVPASRSSGQSSPQLPITKQGDRLLRRLLVQSSHYILGRHGQDSDLKRFGLKLAQHGGKNGKKRAVIAVARKLAVLLHRLWVSEADYVPLYRSFEAN